ncbi:MAG: hypothetical protein WA063_00905 [Minisyncoccia bacterium]
MEVFEVFIAESVVTGIMLWLVVLALAYMEVQTEGKNPWAAALPCWRKIVSWFPKELTGYHAGLVSFTLTLIAFTAVACIFVLGIYGVEIPKGFLGTLAGLLLSMVILLTIFEDFLWHIVNPYQNEYGFHTFTKRKYPAFKKKFVGFVPIDYVAEAVLSFVIAFLAGLMMEWIVIVATLIIMTVATTAIRQKS